MTQLPKQSIWPGLAQGLAGGAGVLSKALDPVEKAQKKLALAQLSYRTRTMEGLQSGKITQDDIDPETMLPWSPIKRLQIAHLKQQMQIAQRNADHNDLVQNSNWDSTYQVPQQGGAPSSPNDYQEPPLPQREQLPSSLSGWGLQDPRSGLAPQIGF